MKILYGFNGVGNGHIARARIMVPKLRAAGADVTCILSGRDADPNLDVGQEGEIIFKDGLRLENKDGKMQFFSTSLGLAKDLPQLAYDALKLDIDEYDLIITDFEPVSAWAAKLKGKPSIGLANHFSLFHDNVPKVGEFSPFMLFMKNIVPADTKLGMHWDSFDEPILPPLFSAPEAKPADPNKILVYLNFENLDHVTSLLENIEGYEFYIYSGKVQQSSTKDNLHYRPLSVDGFKKDFADCAGIIANAGFQTTSEALQLGKKNFVKPLEGQKEQESNVLALEQLNLASTMDELDPEAVRKWLARDDFNKVRYPDVAQAVTQWVMSGDIEDPQPMIDEIWSKVDYQPAP